MQYGERVYWSVIRRILVICLVNVLSIPLYSQEKSHEWFARECLFPMLEYDLLEVQPYAGLMLLFPEKSDYEGLYIPVNIGFRKSFIQWNMLSMRFDLAMGAASYTQFEVIRFDENTLRGGLLNTDFKASGFLFASKDRHHFRMQLFHISSHLGDDYIFRNQDFELNDKSVNYEQIDLTYLYAFEKLDLYGGLGYVFSANAFRDRFMAQLGFQGRHPLNAGLDIAYGADVKIYEENDFQPDYHAGFGITFKQRERQQLNISLDLYKGALPYSTLDFGQVSWVGLSSRVYL